MSLYSTRTWFEDKLTIVLQTSNSPEVYLWKRQESLWLVSESEGRYFAVKLAKLDSQTKTHLLEGGMQLIFCLTDLSLVHFPLNYTISSRGKDHLNKNCRICKASTAIITCLLCFVSSDFCFFLSPFLPSFELTDFWDSILILLLTFSYISMHFLMVALGTTLCITNLTESIQN